MTAESNDPRRLIVFAVLITAATVVGLLLLYHVRNVLILAYVSGLFAMGISPLVRIVERRGFTRLPRWFAILIIYAVIVGVLAGVLAIVIPPFVEQAEDLWRTLPTRIEQAQAWLIRMGILRRPITLGEAVQQAPAAGGATAAGAIFGAVRNVVGGVVGVIALVLLTFYMLVDSRQIFSFFVQLFPRHKRSQVTTIIETVVVKVSAWLGGQLLLAVVIGVTSAVGLGLMGVPYFFVLALISAIGEMIPMVGPILAAIPAILIAAAVSPGLALGVTIFFIIQQQLENHILVPKIMSRQVGLSAVTVIIALAMGIELLGVMGAILSVPTAAIVQVLVQELLTRDG